jgi:Na+-transporting NADH:ubiquinone oxidoreductase subunit NqrD
MKKNVMLFFFALCPLVPISGRFAYGVVICLALAWLFLCGLLFRNLIALIKPGNVGPYLELACLAGAATVFDQALALYSPVLSLSLGFYVYLSAFTYLLLVSIDAGSDGKAIVHPIVPFLPFALAFSALRELLGFGTISLPVREGLREYAVLPRFGEWGMGFWGTAGGALILLGILAWLIKHVLRVRSAARGNS